MEHKAKREKSSILTLWFNGYVDDKAKEVVGILLVLVMPLFWILTLAYAGYEILIAIYFLTIPGAGFMLGLYMIRNSLIEWIWELGARLTRDVKNFYVGSTSKGHPTRWNPSKV